MHTFPWRAAIIATAVALSLQFMTLVISANVTGEVGRTPLIVSQSLGFLAESGRLQLLAAYYLALLPLLHVVPFALLGRGYARSVMLFGREKPSARVMLLVMLTGLLGAMAWSYRLVPESNAVVSSSPLFQMTSIWLLLAAMGCVALILAFIGAVPAFVFQCSRWELKQWQWRAPAVGLVSIVVIATGVSRGDVVKTAAQPNLIVLGLDSVRPDFLGRDSLAPGLMPFLERLEQSFVAYTDAETPIARTGVSWAGVLSGRYPIHNGARFNLYARDAVDDSTWLPRQLAAADYRTAYITDDSRFSNLDASYGFDLASHPPIGLQDFIFGTLSDFVPINLLRHSAAGEYLLPHAWANRAAHHGYRPGESSRRVFEALKQFDPEGHPVFLVTHLCTAHYPYLHPQLAGTSDWKAERQEVDDVDDVARYAAGLRAVDGQLALIWGELEAKGMLSNALVVILSDHGESLGLSADQLKAEDRMAPRSARTVGLGHGTVGLSDAQHKTVLMVQRFVDGRPVLAPVERASPASLIDIAPTLLAAAGLQVPASIDGVNLLAEEPDAGRIRFRETDLRGGALAEMQLDPAAIAREFSDMFELTSKGRVQIREANIDALLKQKQRIAHSQGIFLAYDPDSGAAPWVLYHHASGVRGKPDFESDRTASILRDEVCRHWQGDRDFHAANCP